MSFGVSGGGGDSGSALGAIVNGVKTVTTAGTDVALGTTARARLIFIQAQTDNTNKIAVGGTGVDATVATGTGIILNAGESITIEVPVDIADIYIDSLVDGEGVRFAYVPL